MEGAELSGIDAATIDAPALEKSLYDPGAGAMVTFSGIVRNSSHGRQAVSLFYEAYPEMALPMLDEILSEAKTRFGLIACACRHRTGELVVGDTAVVVVTSSRHRKNAYEANMYIIDRVKFELPIWKKEKFADGSSHWSHNCA